MVRRILWSGLLGAVVLLLWTFIVNAVFGFTVRIAMNRIPDERAVYALLKEQIPQPGAYLANPQLSPSGEFPPGEPVFGIRYSGVGHEAAGGLMLFELATAIVASCLVAALLSTASAHILSRYSHKVLYVAAIGVLLGVSGDLSKFGIGGYPAGAALLLAANRALSWALAGTAMAWTMRAQTRLTRLPRL